MTSTVAKKPVKKVRDMVKGPAAPSAPTQGDLKIKIRRSATEFNGIILEFICPSMEEYMKSICVNQSDLDNAKSEKSFVHSSKDGWKEHAGYRIAENTVGEDPVLSLFHKWGMELRGSDGKPNMAFLRAKGLSTGVSFKLPGMYSETTIKDWANSFRDSYLEFNKRFRGDIDLEMEFITRQKVVI